MRAFGGSGGLSGQFSTRVIALIPVAIAINIVLGATVQQYLKLPIYLDSIGTILVGVLAGPLAGLVTGALANLIWAYVLPAPIGNPVLGPFAITAAVIGILAGIWGYLGVFRSRPARGSQLLGAAAIAAAIPIVLAIPIYNNPAYTDPNVGGYPSWVFAAILAIAVFAAIAVAAFIYIRRDIAGLWVAIAGAVTGIVAALVSAPISAYVFGGVTGGGTDLLVAALRQGGADVLQASTGQGLISDPIDKTITAVVVFIILASLSSRFLARFPLGPRLTRPAEEPVPGTDREART